MNIDTKFILEALPDIAKYIPVTLKLVLVAFLISFPIGVLFAWINHKKVKVISPVVKAYMSLIRGTPGVVIFSMTRLSIESKS